MEGGKDFRERRGCGGVWGGRLGNKVCVCVVQVGRGREMRRNCAGRSTNTMYQNVIRKPINLHAN